MSDREPQYVYGEWRRGWPTVLTGVVGMMTETASFNVTGVVMAPLMAEFGWSRTIVTANVLILSVLTFFMAPLAGRIIQRMGVRRYATVSAVAAVFCMLLATQVNANPLSWYAVWFLFGLTNLGIGPLVWSTATTTLFDRSRGLALALTLSGSGVAYMVVPSLALTVVTHFGWRAVFVVVAISFLAVLVPMTLFALKTSADFDKPAEIRGKAAGSPVALPGFTFAEALARRQFWQLVLLSVAVAVVEGAMAIHLFPILSEGGLDKASAAGVAGSMGLAMIVGRLGTGYLTDKLDVVKVFSGSIVLILAACLLVCLFDGGYVEGFAISVLLGLGAGGTTNVLAYLASHYFGIRAYASIFGIFLGSFACAYGAAPLLASFSRDALGSYVPMFAWSAVAMGVSVVVALLLGRPSAFPIAAAEAKPTGAVPPMPAAAE